MPNILAFIDVETLGLDNLRHRVIEVGYAVVRDDDWSTLKITNHRFKPTTDDFRCAEPKALEVNGYRHGHEDWEGAPECGTLAATEIWSSVARDLEGATLANQNIPFDRKFVWAELCKHHVQRPNNTAYSMLQDMLVDGPWRSEAIEVRQFSREFAKLAGISGSLSPVYEHLKGPKMRMHRSVTDVLAAIWVYAEGLSRFKQTATDDIKEAVRGYIRDNGLEVA